MRLRILVAVLALLVGFGGVNEGHAQKSKKPVKKAAPSKAKRAPARKAPVRRKAATSRASVNQRVPTKDRYAEIQQALADAGYFQGQTDGNWKQDSVEAMRSFQDANGFEPTGKIDARSLIKLKLGPTYDTEKNEAASPAAADTRQPG
jgi:hypothetical protein